MDGLAVDTWDRVARGDARGIRLREDTIAEMNLLDLDMWHPELWIHRFNQNAEKAVGGDWEWYVGSGQLWFALRIQAKRMDNDEYRQLQHEGAVGDNYQYDTLIRVSEAEPILTFPHYVFFNGWRAWPSGVQWYGCPRGFALGRCGHASEREMGCSAMPARLVRAIHAGRGVAGRRVSEYLPWSIPWSWLFGPNPVRSPTGAGRAGASNSTASIRGTRDWGTHPEAPSNPTVLDVLRWHRAIDAVARRVETEKANLSDENDLWGDVRAEFNRLVSDRSQDVAAQTEGLGPLPPHAALLMRTGAEPVNEELVAELSTQIGQRRRTVIVTELDLGDALEQMTGDDPELS